MNIIKSSSVFPFIWPWSFPCYAIYFYLPSQLHKTTDTGPKYDVQKFSKTKQLLKAELDLMYFKALPDHSQPGFDEELHFNRFKKSNVIFNTKAEAGGCDAHVGCLSIKTILSGEEWYGVGKRSMVVRPGQFLILNDDQQYACRVNEAHLLSIFFQKEFASSIFQDCRTNEESSLDDPFRSTSQLPEFFQTLHEIESDLGLQLSTLVSTLESNGYDANVVNEHLLFLLRHLIQVHAMEGKHVRQVGAMKKSTQIEIYKRLCLAKDVLHSSFMDSKLDVNTISSAACLSVPQLIRQFKMVFQCTPHQYLMRLRLQHSARLLTSTDHQVNDITWHSGFENASAFGRAFKTAYGVPPESYRRQSSVS